jgi:excisionase family DNA binding protein
VTLIEQIATRRTAMTLKEFASMMGINYATAWDMANDGRLPVMRVGSSLRLDPKTTAEWLHQRTSSAA